jgi:hypothetical protein
MHPWGIFIYFLGETKQIFEGNAITSLISRTTLRGFFCHSNHTQEKLF